MDELLTGLSQMKKKSLSDEVHDKILEEIVKTPVTEELVLNERKLTEMFGVSKAPVREALIKLCSEDVLKSVPRFGYLVTQLTEKECREITQMRANLELNALDYSFPIMTDQKLKQIEDQIRRASRKKNVDVWEVWEDNVEFHLLLASFSENKILMKFLRTCMGMERRVYAQSVWRERKTMVDSVEETPHKTIFERLQARDEEGTRAALKRDILSVHMK